MLSLPALAGRGQPQLEFGGEGPEGILLVLQAGGQLVAVSGQSPLENGIAVPDDPDRISSGQMAALQQQLESPYADAFDCDEVFLNGRFDKRLWSVSLCDFDPVMARLAALAGLETDALRIGVALTILKKRHGPALVRTGPDVVPAVLEQVSFNRGARIRRQDSGGSVDGSDDRNFAVQASMQEQGREV